MVELTEEPPPEELHVDRLLSDVGIMHSSKILQDSPSILESSLDLSTDRLTHVFSLFDTDQDGKITYEKLKEGFETEVGSLYDDAGFETLIQHLDQDQSGDISCAEFIQGFRTLVLHRLMRIEVKEDCVLEVYDYSPIRLQCSKGNIGGPYHPSVRSSSFASLDSTGFFNDDAPDWSTSRWIHVMGHEMTVLQRLAAKYALHPLAIEDALDPSTLHRAKVETYQDHYFLMIPICWLETVQGKKRVTRTWWGGSQAKAIRSTKKVHVQMISIFVNVPVSDTLISYQASCDYPWHHRVQADLEKSYSKLRQYDAQYLTYALLDLAVDLLGPLTNELRKEIGAEGDYQRLHGFASVTRLDVLQDEVEKIARTIKPFLRLVTHVIEDDAISPGATLYLRDVLDNLEGMDDEVKRLIEDCQDLLHEADKFQSRQMDQTLYTLTVVSSIFLPAQFLTGVWGMNFTNMPELNEKWGYPMFWSLTAFMTLTLCFTLNFGRLRNSA